MRRWSEMVLEGHPDKLCDQFADAVLAEAYRADPEAYGQVEAGLWCDRVWLSGAVVAREGLERPVEDAVREAGRAAGVAMERYRFDNHLCVYRRDPLEWTRHVNDQALVVGWAGYDERTRWLPPEHFLAHRFREALAGQGPDGKLLVQVDERGDWRLERLVVTLQQAEGTPFLDFTLATLRALQAAYDAVRAADERWSAPWSRVEVLVNPNGPLVGAGSDFDNGQTGRKLVMDYYGPRVPLGGGALSGKHLTHIDRLAAYRAREAAVRAVATGARECRVELAYAPGVLSALAVAWTMEGQGERVPDEDFAFGAMAERYETSVVTADLGRGTHFWNPELPWNRVD